MPVKVVQEQCNSSHRRFLNEGPQSCVAGRSGRWTSAHEMLHSSRSAVKNASAILPDLIVIRACSGGNQVLDTLFLNKMVFCLKILRAVKPGEYHLSFFTALSVLALPIFPVRLQTSIFGASELNFRVRDGNGWTLTAINTNSDAFPHPQNRTKQRLYVRQAPAFP